MISHLKKINLFNSFAREYITPFYIVANEFVRIKDQIVNCFGVTNKVSITNFLEETKKPKSNPWVKSVIPFRLGKLIKALVIRWKYSGKKLLFLVK